MLAALEWTPVSKMLGVETEVTAEKKRKKWFTYALSQIREAPQNYLWPRMLPQCILCTRAVFLTSDNWTKGDSRNGLQLCWLHAGQSRSRGWELLFPRLIPQPSTVQKAVDPGGQLSESRLWPRTGPASSCSERQPVWYKQIWHGMDLIL